jgi:hypothetical protein
MTEGGDAAPASGWELTGNQYVAAPEISLADGAIHSLNVVHRGLGGLVSWSAEPTPVPAGETLLRLRVRIDGVDYDPAGLRWERIDRWIPRWHAQLGQEVAVTGTVCFPGGPDAALRGGMLLVELQYRGRHDREAEIVLDGCWRYSQLVVASRRSLAGNNRLVRGALHDGVALETGQGASAAAIAIAMEGDDVRAGRGRADLAPLDSGVEHTAPNGEVQRFRIARAVRLRAGRTVASAFYIGAAPERDGALATAAHFARIGADEIMRLARLDLSRLARKTSDAGAAGLLNRNLLFACYAGIARAIDDDRLYFVRSRAPTHGACAVFGEREALLWLLPALTAADPFMAREALMRAFEQYSHRPGERARYLDGGVLEPGFCLDQFLAYPIALDRYVTAARDTSILDEPLVQDVLREIDDALFARLDPEYFLCATELLPSGEKADYPFVAYDNALVWRYADALPRIWRRRQGDPPPRFEKAGEEIAAALWQRCTVEVDGMRVIGYASDLRGNVAIYDDPAGSLRLLPHLGFCSQDDPIWSNTMELLHSKMYPLWHGERAYPGLAGRSRPGLASLAGLCSDLLTARRDAALRTLRGLRLDGGFAAEAYDPDTGHVAAGPFSASLAGFLAWSLMADQSAAAQTRPRERRRA